MMLNLPADCERWPEFQMFDRALRENSDRLLTWHAFGRLWVDLGYQAQLTGRPGALTEQGADLYRGGFDVGSRDWIWKALQDAGFLKEQEQKTESGELKSEWFCARFARLHAHLEPGRTKEVRGAEHSAIKRNQRNIQAAAAAQGLLLSTLIFKKRDGSDMNDRQCRRAMILIMTCDRTLGKRNRLQGEYTEGLMADAAHADSVLPQEEEERNKFFYALSDKRAHPMLPKTTEQLLTDIEGVVGLLQS